MTDKLSKKERSANMSRIRSTNTRPEIIVRRALHQAGLRFRLHAKELPGRPDVVFRPDRVCILVHGCFWHGCTKCVDGLRVVKSNSAYWSDKVAENKARDLRNRRALKELGWKVLEIWECETSQPRRLGSLIAKIQKARATRP